MPAYASAWKLNECYEYAVVNEEENSISYVYLQPVDDDELIIDGAYVPQGYADGLSASRSFSVDPTT